MFPVVLPLICLLCRTTSLSTFLVLPLFFDFGSTFPKFTSWPVCSKSTPKGTLSDDFYKSVFVRNSTLSQSVSVKGSPVSLLSTVVSFMRHLFIGTHIKTASHKSPSETGFLGLIPLLRSHKYSRWYYIYIYCILYRTYTVHKHTFLQRLSKHLW